MINNGVRDHPQDALADDHDAVAARHRAISDLLDPFTQWRIAALEPDLTGARVLAIGPGYGNLAWWLGEQVGATGQVVAFSRDVSHLPHHPQVSLVGHDLTTGTVPVSGPFDLIHARLTLAYTSHRRQLLHQLANRLGPGGWLLVEDWAISERDRDVVVRAASLVEQDLYERFHRALTRVFAVSGTDSRWGAHLHTHFLEEELRQVRTLIHQELWSTGHPGLRLVMALAEQYRSRLAECGVSGAQLGRLLRMTLDPELIIRGWPLFSVSGQRLA